MIVYFVRRVDVDIAGGGDVAVVDTIAVAVVFVIVDLLKSGLFVILLVITFVNDLDAILISASNEVISKGWLQRRLLRLLLLLLRSSTDGDDGLRVNASDVTSSA